MKCFLVMAVAIFSVEGSNVGRNVGGWESSSTTTTTTPAPTGWPSPETTTTTPAPPSGWPAPLPGWGVSSNAELSAAFDAIGYGSAGASHFEVVSITGDDSNPAALSMAAASDSLVANEGSIVQLTSIDSEGNVNTLNAASSSNIAEGSDGAIIDASGNTIDVIQAGWSASGGVGITDSNADTNVSNTK